MDCKVLLTHLSPEQGVGLPECLIIRVIRHFQLVHFSCTVLFSFIKISLLQVWIDWTQRGEMASILPL